MKNHAQRLFQRSFHRPGSVAAQYLGVSVDGEPEQARTLLVEKDKPEQERGYYTDPALYGAPKEMGMLYAHPSSAKAR